jgi:hypothetical protein
VVSGALARWLRSRKIRTEGLEMRALVPVSVRTEDQRHTLGNQLAALRGPLPVYITDPLARLRFIRQAMDGLKESKQAVGAATIAAVNNLAPPTILDQASRLQFSTRLFNLIVTNIPGPQFPLYVLGRRLQDLFPVAFLPQHHALAVAIMSYDGGIDYGLLGDYDALPDIDVIAEGIEESLAELLRAAREKSARATSRAAVKPSGAATEPDGETAAEAAGARESDGDPAPSPEPDEQPTPILPAAGGRPKRGPASDMRARRTRDGRSPSPASKPPR